MLDSIIASQLFTLPFVTEIYIPACCQVISESPFERSISPAPSDRGASLPETCFGQLNVNSCHILHKNRCMIFPHLFFIFHCNSYSKRWLFLQLRILKEEAIWCRSSVILTHSQNQNDEMQSRNTPSL